MQQNKKENLCEFSFSGFKIKDEKLNPIIEELFENSACSYKYEISTYRLQYRSKEGIDNLFNLVEIHKNLFEPYEKDNKEFLVNPMQFFNNVQFPEKVDEFFIFSRFHVKYIANTIVHYPDGSANIIEFSRAEDKIDSFFTKLGYTEISRIRKIGEFFRFKNYPIILLSLKYIDTTPWENPNVNQESKYYDVVEVLCYCKETEKEFYWPILKEIKNKLSKFLSMKDYFEYYIRTKVNLLMLT